MDGWVGVGGGVGVGVGVGGCMVDGERLSDASYE